MKQLIISSELLKKALKKVGQVINNNTVLPVLKNVYCKVYENSMDLITADLEVTISYKCDIDGVQGAPFEFLLPFEFINKVLTVAGNEPIKIQLPKAWEKAIIHLESERFDAGALDNPSDFVQLPETPNEFTMEMDEHFISALTTALTTASKDQLRISMTRVVLDMHPDASYVVSTDAHALYRYKVDVVPAEAKQIQFNAKMVKAIEDLHTVFLSYGDKRVALQSDTVTVWCQLFEDRYPDYSLIIPKYPANMKVKKQDVVDAMHKALIAANSSNQVNIFLKKELGVIHYESSNADTARETVGRIAGDYSGEVDVIALNAKKVLTMMAQVKVNEVDLHIHNATKAVLITTEEDKNYLGLLMPLMV